MKNQDEFSGTVCIRLWNNGNLVLVLNKTKSLPNGAVKPEGWGLPTGSIKKKEDETRESPLEAAKRELKEETGLEADFEEKPVRVEHRRDGHQIFTFDAYSPHGQMTAEKDPAGGVSKVRWFHYNEWSQEEFEGVRIYRSTLKRIDY